jgi:hypothetical protein
MFRRTFFVSLSFSPLGLLLAARFLLLSWVLDVPASGLGGPLLLLFCLLGVRSAVTVPCSTRPVSLFRFLPPCLAGQVVRGSFLLGSVVCAREGLPTHFA